MPWAAFSGSSRPTTCWDVSFRGSASVNERVAGQCWPDPINNARPAAVLGAYPVFPCSGEPDKRKQKVLEVRMKLHQLLALVLLLPVGSLMAAEETLVEHEGHRGLWLRSDAAEVFIGIEPQFRVLSFRRPGEPSLMAGQNVAETGLRLAFMEPDQVPASFDVGNVPAEVLERTPRSVRVRLKAAAGLQYTVRMQLDEADPALMLWYELANAGDKPRQVACWSVTSFARQGMIIAPFDQ